MRNCNLEVISSNPPPCHQMNLCSVVLNSTPPDLVTSDSKPLGIVNKFSVPVTICFFIYSGALAAQGPPSGAP